MHKEVFIDTNIFLHYQPFSQIDWLEVTKASSVSIVIPPIIIRELNKHKDTNVRPQIRKRAANAIKFLYDLFRNENSSELRKNISIIFEDREPSVDFHFYQLSPSTQDDQLIASILSRKQELVGETYLLITSDIGLNLLTKAKRLGIEACPMLEKYLLKEEVDLSDKKIKDLEKEVLELSSRIPKLSLLFSDGNNYINFKIEAPDLHYQQLTDDEIENIKNEYPILNFEETQIIETSEKNSDRALSRNLRVELLNNYPQEEFDRYNLEVEKYVEAIKVYLKERITYRNLLKRIFKIEIKIINTGTTPGEDVDVFMHFPNGFNLISKSNFPNEPKVPRKPIRPRTSMEVLNDSLRINFPMSLSIPNRGINQEIGRQQPNITEPTIRKTNSFEVTLHVEKIKHNLFEIFEPLYIMYGEDDPIESFDIDYRILAANVPQKVDGRLHINFNK